MPFQRQIPDIPVQARPVAEPATNAGIAQGIQQLGQVAGQTVQDIQTNKAHEQISNISEVTTTVGAAKEAGAVFDQSGQVDTSNVDSQLAAQIAAVKRKAGDRFTRIAAAVSQGAKPKQAAALEAESAIRELVNQTPGFEDEIRQQARDLLGYDPTGFALRQTLDVTAPTGTHKLTQFEKDVQTAEAVHEELLRAGQDISVDTILGNMGVIAHNKMLLDNANTELSRGSITFNQWAQKAFSQRGPDLASTLDLVAKSGAENGLQDPQIYTNAVQQQMEVERQAVRRKAAELGGVDSTEYQKALDQVSNMYRPLLDNIKNNSLGEILGQRLDVVAKLNKRMAAQTTPMLTFLSQAYSPQIAVKLLDMMDNLTDPKQFDLVYKFDPGIKTLIDQGQMTQAQAGQGALGYINKVFRGEPLAPEDLQFRHLAETAITQPGQDQTMEEYVKSLGNTSPIRAASIIAQKIPRARATEGEVGWMRSQFNTYIGQPAQEGLPGNLIDQAAREIIDFGQPDQMMEGVHIDPNGKLGISVATGRGRTRTTSQLRAMKKIQPFLDAVNNGGWATEFKVDRDTFHQEIIRRIQDRVTYLQEQEAEKQDQGASRGQRGGAANTTDGLYSDGNGNIVEVKDGKATVVK